MENAWELGGYCSGNNGFPNWLWKRPNNKCLYAPGLEQGEPPTNLEPRGRGGDASKWRSDHGGPLLLSAEKAGPTHRLVVGQAWTVSALGQEASWCVCLSQLPSLLRLEGSGFPASGRLWPAFLRRTRLERRAITPRLRDSCTRAECETWSGRGSRHTCSLAAPPDTQGPRENGRIQSLDSFCDEESSPASILTQQQQGSV